MLGSIATSVFSATDLIAERRSMLSSDEARFQSTPLNRPAGDTIALSDAAAEIADAARGLLGLPDAEGAAFSEFVALIEALSGEALEDLFGEEVADALRAFAEDLPRLIQATLGAGSVEEAEAAMREATEALRSVLAGGGDLAVQFASEAQDPETGFVGLQIVTLRFDDSSGAFAVDIEKMTTSTVEDAKAETLDVGVSAERFAYRSIGGGEAEAADGAAASVGSGGAPLHGFTPLLVDLSDQVLGAGNTPPAAMLDTLLDALRGGSAEEDALGASPAGLAASAEAQAQNAIFAEFMESIGLFAPQSAAPTAMAVDDRAIQQQTATQMLENEILDDRGGVKSLGPARFHETARDVGADLYAGEQGVAARSRLTAALERAPLLSREQAAEIAVQADPALKAYAALEQRDAVDRTEHDVSAVENAALVETLFLQTYSGFDFKA